MGLFATLCETLTYSRLSLTEILRYFHDSLSWDFHDSFSWDFQSVRLSLTEILLDFNDSLSWDFQSMRLSPTEILQDFHGSMSWDFHDSLSWDFHDSLFWDFRTKKARLLKRVAKTHKMPYTLIWLIHSLNARFPWLIVMGFFEPNMWGSRAGWQRLIGCLQLKRLIHSYVWLASNH